MYMLWFRFKVLPFELHLLLAFCIRVIFIIYGSYHDTYSSVKYTDVDYSVFTDASRHILKGNSPFDRHTYRYSPIVSLLLIPNVTVHFLYGKFLFALIDLFVGILIRLIVINNFTLYDRYRDNASTVTKEKRICASDRGQNENFKGTSKIKINTYDDAANISMFMWLYNPMVIAISTRGNCDSLAGLLILSTLYFLQCRKQNFVSGVIYGLAIHLRLYPIIYSLTLYIFSGEFAYYTNRNQRLKKVNTIEFVKNVQVAKQYLNTNFKNNLVIQFLIKCIPNFSQTKFIVGTFFSLFILTGIFYYFYGYTFLFETYLYHLVRQDCRHNFSLFFYLQYVTASIKNITVWQKLLVNLPKVILLLVVSFHYGSNKFAINFSILLQTIIMVIYNTVLTSQYFVWIMAVLPLCIWQINTSKKELVFLIASWFLAQLAWLLPAYLLEFQGQNTFMFIWMQGISFFCVNIAVLGRLVKNFVVVKEKIS